MDISIIIVSYNVKLYLEQCLNSVLKALSGISGEVFVVDNCSVDGSCQLIKEKFSWVKLIENKSNIGFSKANNLAIRKSKGRYILLLNPDTLIQEDTFIKVVRYCDENKNIGGLGVKMIDGNGRYLPESKRSLPTPLTAMYKVFGLARLFPHSKIFSKYNLGHLNKDENNKIEILAGAFMLIRKETLDKTGLLDEDFFMYGEDIDLSYRIIKAGYENFYFANTTIIHYKGKSTKKASLNYILLFYRAMLIFANKHFSSKQAKLLTTIINTAIYFRAFLGVVKRIVLVTFNPIMDFLIIYLGFLVFVPLWGKYKFGTIGYYPDILFYFIIPSYILVWLISGFFLGLYEKTSFTKTIFRSVFTGSLIILIIYALLPEQFRYSRALILIGSFWVFFALILTRIIASFIIPNQVSLVSKKYRTRIALIGSKHEVEGIREILEHTGIKFEIAGRITIDKSDDSIDLLGNIEQIDEIVKINNVDQVIFCSDNIAVSDIIETILSVTNLKIDYKIASKARLILIGNNIIGDRDDLFSYNFNSLVQRVNKRKKRMFDIITSILIIFLSPVLLVINNGIKEYFRNCFKVIFGDFTWVKVELPHENYKFQKKQKKGVFTPADLNKIEIFDDDIKKQLNIAYVKDYKIRKDIKIIIKNLNQLSKIVE